MLHVTYALLKAQQKGVQELKPYLSVSNLSCNDASDTSFNAWFAVDKSVSSTASREYYDSIHMLDQTFRHCSKKGNPVLRQSLNIITAVQKFVMQPGIPVETAMKVYRRYLKIEPLHTEEYIAYLKGKVKFHIIFFKSAIPLGSQIESFSFFAPFGAQGKDQVSP